MEVMSVEIVCHQECIGNVSGVCLVSVLKEDSSLETLINVEHCKVYTVQYSLSSRDVRAKD